MRYSKSIEVGNAKVLFYNRQQLIDDDLDACYVTYGPINDRMKQVLMVPNTYVEQQEEDNE